ncbi:unnamed protein product [Effrenium voratum]|nr:unnamed protein product [Effrenium voratum]
MEFFLTSLLRGHGRQPVKLLDLQPLKRFTQRILNLRGESDVLKGQLEEAQMEAGLNDAAALEMQRAFEEEVEYQKAAQEMIGRQFVNAQSSHLNVLKRLEDSSLNHMQQFEDMSKRLKKSLAAQKEAENKVKGLTAESSSLQRQVRKLQGEKEKLMERLGSVESSNATQKQEIAEQAALINDLLETLNETQDRNRHLRDENRVLRTRLESLQMQLDLLL